MNNQCIAIKASGFQCGKRVMQEEGSTRCIMHQKSITTNGPHAQQLKELKYVHQKEKKDLEFNLLARFGGRWENVTPDARDQYVNAANRMVARQSVEKHDMIHRQMEANHRQGVNPDADANARRDQRRRQRAEANRERIRWFREQEEFQRRQRAAGEAMMNAVDRIQRDEDARIAAQARFAENPVGHIQRALDAQAQQGELHAFVNDRQNVHTSAAVKQTKEIVERIRKIPVPEGYRWHATESSKTPFEIGLECKLSQKAAWQMISQYAQDTAIYDIEPGIYGKVLDCVWQYIKNSPDKADMCVIIKSEMEDNIGMCAQGNLSRICNILAGILEGVGSQESLSERLGRLFGPLMEIEDMRDRIARGINILQENHVPSDEWSVWMEPLNEIEV
jgi:hypothetical protein